VSQVNALYEQVRNRGRITDDDALRLFKEADLISLGKLAQERSAVFHPPEQVTFIIDRNINYTNICTSGCRFCAFYREASSPDAYFLSPAEILEKVSEAVAIGATQIMLQGGLNPLLGMDYFTDVLQTIKKHYAIFIHSFSPPEIIHLTKISGLSIEAVLKKLCAAGLDSLPGGGAEILSDRVRHLISPHKISTGEWLSVMHTAHQIGMKTTATMMIGSVETIEERVAHLRSIRDLQDKTNGFRAFIPWSFKTTNTELGGEEVSSLDYLRTLAISRIYLDNIENIQGSWVTQGPDIGQMTLLFGANDLGSIMLEENVVRAAGASYRLTESEMVTLIRSADKIPAQRNTEYKIIKTYLANSIT
jgi:cyclic dehypoxanthinyl futalosine synthase